MHKKSNINLIFLSPRIFFLSPNNNTTLGDRIKPLKISMAVTDNINHSTIPSNLIILATTVAVILHVTNRFEEPVSFSQKIL